MDNSVVVAETHLRENGTSAYRDKLLDSGYKVVAVNTADGIPVFTEPVDVRIYRSTSYGTYYACVWIQHPAYGGFGTGRATGGNYDRQSAAVGEALRNAGVVLEKRIDGVGQNAVIGALTAIAEWLGCTMYHVVHYEA